MTDTVKPLVRLEVNSSRPVRQKVRPDKRPETIKLAIRLNASVNEALRSLTRYRGDLSTMASEALDVVHLSRVPLVSATERMVRDTTITMPRTLHKKVKKTAEERATSMNILVNTALAHWLAKKDMLRLG